MHVTGVNRNGSPDMTDLTDQTALVTGASTGIGAAAVRTRSVIR